MTAVLSPKQAASIREATARINVWEGAVRSGKTVASLIAWADHVARAPGRFAMAGKTKDTLGRNALDPLAEMFGDYAPGALVWTPGAATAVLMGRLVHLIGANDAKAEAKIRGATLHGLYADEATTFPEAFWNQALLRLSPPGAAAFATCNPDNPRHWFKRRWLDRADVIDLRRWHFTLEDNPALDPAFRRAIELENVGLYRRRFVLGEWVAAEGAIYEAWDPDRHVVDTYPPIVRWLGVGVDYGTTNPFDAVLGGVGSDGRVYIVREWRWDSAATRRRLTDAEYARDLAAARAGWSAEHAGADLGWTVVDPSAASFRTQLWRDGWTGVHPADNRVADGIRLVASAIATDRLRVHRSCAGLIGEVPGYTWDAAASDRGDDQPVKADDHAVDALRYLLATTEHLWRDVPVVASAVA